MIWFSWTLFEYVAYILFVSLMLLLIYITTIKLFVTVKLIVVISHLDLTCKMRTFNIYFLGHFYNYGAGKCRSCHKHQTF